MIATTITRLIRVWRVKNATKTADRLAKRTKKKHYVLQIHERLRVLNRTQINLLIARRLLHKRLRKAYELDKIAIHVTT